MANVLSIVNTIRANASEMYQQRIPEATQTNLSKIGELLGEYQEQQNEFLNALVNRIAFTIVSNRRYKNPLAVLKKGHVPFGVDIQDIFTNPAEDEGFTADDMADLLAEAKPDVKVMYHRKNRKGKYKVTVEDADLRGAFTSEAGFNKLLTSITTSMYSGDEMDEFMLMKNAVSEAIEGGKIVSQTVTYTGDEESCKELVKAIKTYSGLMEFPSTAHNGFNKVKATEISGGTIKPVTTWTPAENQVLLIRADVDAATDVEVLAKAFNMDKAEFMKRKIKVDSFGDTKTLAVICDEGLFQFYDNVYKTASFFNGAVLKTTYWLHHHQTLSLSLFANAVALVEA